MIKDYVNSIKSYPHDENFYLFKKDLINKISSATIEQLTQLDLDKEEDKHLIIENTNKLTVYDDCKLFLAAISIYN